MDSVVGVSIGATAVRFVRHEIQETHETQKSAEAFTDFSSAAPIPAMDGVASILTDADPGTVVCVASRDETRADTVRALMAAERFTRYRIVPEVHAALTWLDDAGVLDAMSVVALYDLGSSGLSFDIVELGTSDILFSERTHIVSGEALDALIGEAQLRKRDALYAADPPAHGRAADVPSADRHSIPRPYVDPVSFERSCRTAKEQLSTSNGVCVGSDAGLILLSLSAFELMISPLVEQSARLVSGAIKASPRPVDAVILIGGGARIPLVGSMLASWTGVRTVVAENPEWVTARGAALLATDHASDLAMREWNAVQEARRRPVPIASRPPALNEQPRTAAQTTREPTRNSVRAARSHAADRDGTAINRYWGKAALVAAAILLALAVFGLIEGNDSSARSLPVGTVLSSQIQ